MIGMIAMIGVDQLCAGRNLIGDRIGPIGPIWTRDCAWPCTYGDRPSQFLCMHMCTHAQNGSADRLKRHARYFMDIISSTPMRRGPSAELFYCCTSPQIPLHTAQKIEIMCIIPQHIRNMEIYRDIAPTRCATRYPGIERI
jgi:hypothetical protein